MSYATSEEWQFLHDLSQRERIEEREASEVRRRIFTISTASMRNLAMDLLNDRLSPINHDQARSSDAHQASSLRARV